MDEITGGLQRRLLSSQQATDTESCATVPSSTSPAFMTIGSTVPSASWELQSAPRGSELAPAPTAVSAMTVDSVSALMRQTVECNEEASRTLSGDCIASKTVDDEVRQSPRDGSEILSQAGQPLPQNSQTRTLSDPVVYYTDSLNNAQMLLERLNEMTLWSSQSAAAAAADHSVEDDDELPEDDTLANIWALRQSARRDDSDDVESLGSTIPPNEHDVSCRTLNDDTFAAIRTADDRLGRGDELGDDREQTTSVKLVGESGDAWPINDDDVAETANDKLLLVSTSTKVLSAPAVDVQSAGHPSSPLTLPQCSSPTQKSRSLRRAAVHRRKQLCTGNSGSDSDSNSDDDFVTSLRLRHRRPQHCQLVPHSQPPAAGVDSLEAPANDDGSSAVQDDVVLVDVVGRVEDVSVTVQHDTEDSHQNPGDGSSIETVRPAYDNPVPLNDVIHDPPSTDQHSASHNDDNSYPSQQMFIQMLNAVVSSVA